MSDGDRGGARPWSAHRAAGRPGWRAVLQLLAVAVFLLAGTTGAGLLIGSDVPRYDHTVVAWTQRMRSDVLTAAMLTLTDLGSMRTLGPAVALAAAWLAWRRRCTAAVASLVAAVGVVVLTNAAKALVGWARPGLDGLVDVDSPSFPSGHAAQSAAILLVLAVVLARRRSGRVTALVVAVGLVLGVGLTRVYLGVHYPSDVLGGWVLGGLWAAATVRVLGGPAAGRPGSRVPVTG